jgi:putative endonuclease
MAMDVNARLKQHNNGKSKYTKGHLPWKLIYAEVHTNWLTARQREKYLKSAAGKIWLKNNLPFTDE